MITFFCPKCWKEIKGGVTKCPYCDADITEYEKKNFREKLLNALGHPERETVHRAVWILGRLRSVDAVKPLIGLFGKTDSSFLKAAILDALGEIETPEALDFIVHSLNSEVSMVKIHAREIIEKLWVSHEKK